MNEAEQAIVKQAIVLLTVMLEDAQAEACPKCGGQLVLTAKKNRLKCSRNTGSDGGCGYSTIRTGARTQSASSTASYTQRAGRA
jgi:ribosomal protein S27AE